MPWEDIAPDGLGSELKRAVMTAIGHSYEENCRRYAPDDVGDNNISFSHTVRENLRFLLQAQIHESPELTSLVEVHWKGLIYELRLPGDICLHIYKAPPGISDVRKLRFEGSKRQIDILEVNADQLALDMAKMMGEEAAVESEGGAGRHVVIIHFGDPVDGLSKIVAGEPFLSDLEAPDWIWIESLSDGVVVYERDDEFADETPTAEADDDDFNDLRMREDIDEGESEDSRES